MSLLLDISPVDLGLPAKFTEFRPVQAEALDYIMAATKTHIAGCAPTGIGKSLLGVAVAKTLGMKAVYLTATKALQAQILFDFKACGIVDIRGRNNYPCSVYTTKSKTNVSCQEGFEQGCHLAVTTKCPYFQTYENAKCADLIVTNYSYWLHARSNAADALQVPDGDPIELLICDEAHDAMEELGRFLNVFVPREEYARKGDDAMPKGDGLMVESSGDRWRGWAAGRAKEVNAELTALKIQHGGVGAAKHMEGERYANLERIKKKLDSIRGMAEDWVWETDDNGVRFECVWPGKYSYLLWSGVPKVLLLSATLLPYTMRLLGLKKDQYEYKAFQNGWPPNRAPVYYLPTIKLNYKSPESDYKTLAEQIDAIIEARPDRKGLVQSVSYARMKTLLKHTKYRHLMFYNDSSAESMTVANQFRRAKAPAVLISPSYSTGWDFAYDQCEYQIIPKIPWPYAESRVMKERVKAGDYRTYCTMLALRQMIGRPRRAPDDRCETFILDKNLQMLLHHGRQFTDKSYRIHTIADIPPKPEKLRATNP